MRFCILTTAFISLMSAGQLAAQPETGDSARVVAVVEEFHRAIAKGDQAAVTRLIAEDAIMMEAGGVETRAQYLKDHLPADAEFEKSVTTKRSAVQVVVLADAAWATSTSEFAGTFQGRAVDSIGTELIVLSRAADSWRIRAIAWTGRARRPPQPTPAPQAPGK
jgi:ketosteroid isomerase-like protein